MTPLGVPVDQIRTAVLKNRPAAAIGEERERLAVFKHEGEPPGITETTVHVTYKPLEAIDAYRRSGSMRASFTSAGRGLRGAI
jgi:hypothetical protein